MKNFHSLLLWAIAVSTKAYGMEMANPSQDAFLEEQKSIVPIPTEHANPEGQEAINPPHTSAAPTQQSSANVLHAQITEAHEKSKKIQERIKNLKNLAEELQSDQVRQRVSFNLEDNQGYKDALESIQRAKDESFKALYLAFEAAPEKFDFPKELFNYKPGLLDSSMLVGDPYKLNKTDFNNLRGYTEYLEKLALYRDMILEKVENDVHNTFLRHEVMDFEKKHADFFSAYDEWCAARENCEKAKERCSLIERQFYADRLKNSLYLQQYYCNKQPPIYGLEKQASDLRAKYLKEKLTLLLLDKEGAPSFLQELDTLDADLNTKVSAGEMIPSVAVQEPLTKTLNNIGGKTATQETDQKNPVKQSIKNINQKIDGCKSNIASLMARLTSTLNKNRIMVTILANEDLLNARKAWNTACKKSPLNELVEALRKTSPLNELAEASGKSRIMMLDGDMNFLQIYEQRLQSLGVNGDSAIKQYNVEYSTHYPIDREHILLYRQYKKIYQSANNFPQELKEFGQKGEALENHDEFLRYYGDLERIEQQRMKQLENYDLGEFNPFSEIQSKIKELTLLETKKCALETLCAHHEKMANHAQETKTLMATEEAKSFPETREALIKKLGAMKRKEDRDHRGLTAAFMGGIYNALPLRAEENKPEQHLVKDQEKQEGLTAEEENGCQQYLLEALAKEEQLTVI